MTYKKKLIEVALPLPEINDASAYDKMPGIGPHPKGIHHWWARLPLPTARAVLFASVVDDPSEHPELFPTEIAQNAERERLFGILRRMMQKRLHDHSEVYAEAHAEMLRHCGGKLPPLLDPFAGGGSIPLEGSRLGFEAHGSDLNPVAALLNKLNLEIVPRWANQPPVNRKSRAEIGGTEGWVGSRGLAEDVRYYGGVIHQRAIEKIGHLYPKIALPKEHGSGEATVVAWIWVHTVATPNPAMQRKYVPLASSFLVSSTKEEKVWAEPILDSAVPDGWRFTIQSGTPGKTQFEKIKLGTKTGKAKDFFCLLSGVPIPRSYVQAEGKVGRLKQRLMAIAAKSRNGRVYLAPSADHEHIATSLMSDSRIDEIRSTLLSGALPTRAEITGGVCSAYGLSTWGHLFTSRQLSGLLVVSDLVKEIREEVKRDALHASFTSRDTVEYSIAVSTFLSMTIDRCACFNTKLCRWGAANEKVMNLFGRQALPMIFDYAEANLFGDSVGAWSTCNDYISKCIEILGRGLRQGGHGEQNDAAVETSGVDGLLVSTDPPYYNNISYATLSDFFYVWLRRTLGDAFPDLFATLLVPKIPELIAAADRFGGDHQKAKEHFESGFRKSFSSLRRKLDSRFPLTVYYAFKQEAEEASEPNEEEKENNEIIDLTTGWETMLEALLESGFQITATWPVRASQKWRMVSKDSNALASYIVLSCRPRVDDALRCGRREFLVELRAELPSALRHLQQGNVAPVDFAQAAIGPGISVFSRYGCVLESNGKPMTVRAALGLINQVKDELLGEADADYDPYTRWALTWYDQNGFATGDFGDANTLATAHAVAVSGLKDAGLVRSGEGEVRLLRPEELVKDLDPDSANRTCIWLMTHHLVRRYFVDKAGDTQTAALLRNIGVAGESARDLAYRLFSIAERRKRSQDAQGYNALVLGWPEIVRLAQAAPAIPAQAKLI